MVHFLDWHVTNLEEEDNVCSDNKQFFLNGKKIETEQQTVLSVLLFTIHDSLYVLSAFRVGVQFTRLRRMRGQEESCFWKRAIVNQVQHGSEVYCLSQGTCF